MKSNAFSSWIVPLNRNSLVPTCLTVSASVYLNFCLFIYGPEKKVKNASDTSGRLTGDSDVLVWANTLRFKV